MRREIPLGLLYSVTGTYGAIGRDALDGALLALEEINRDETRPISFKAVSKDPGGNIDSYHRMSEAMLREQGCRHVVGTITSIGRKEVIPIIEKYDALLWYILPYEGFEACENVIYTGAAPNQHILPLFAHLIPTYGNRVYLTGSNYIWGWETNRIARELVLATKGEILGERYLPLDDTDVERMITEVEQKRPDFILNNLIGTSSYAFLQAYHQLGLKDADFLPAKRPVVSCDLTECELADIGFEAAAGHLCSAVYFEDVDNPLNALFRTKVTEKFGADRPLSAFLVGGYAAIHMIAEAIAGAGTDEIEPVKQALFTKTFDTAQGPITIDAKTNHAALIPHLGRINDKGGFDIVLAAESPVPADPYLVDFDPQAFAEEVGRARTDGSSHLRLVK
ncbi:transporter substrate-binding domain-containing protein [Pelagibius sp. Alg239-R121]|uniref:transporter substrate-binding domain-containing protein n=1 Tax=Pelagibius sp. Alg239-R121 TaxID=2993448 RepID=UPI0024A6461D|nr:transporter substrate-binding domain-containing protein [Pelagibius sp. Alg239-R121]